MTDPAAPTPQPASEPDPTTAEALARLRASSPVDLGAAGLAISTFLWSLLPFYTFSISIGGFSESGSASAWHGFFGWAGVLLAVAAGLLLLARLARLPQVAGRDVPTIALAALGVAVLFLVLALVVTPGGGCGGVAICESGVDFGRGIGYWLTLLAAIAATALVFRARRRA